MAKKRSVVRREEDRTEARTTTTKRRPVAARPAAKKPVEGNDAYRRAIQGLVKDASDKAYLMLPDGRTVRLGIRIPFVLQFILDVTHLPLGALYMVAGQKASNKSSLLFYLAKLFYDAGGLCDYANVEEKISAELAASIAGYPDEIRERDGLDYYPRVINDRPFKYMDDWQTWLQRRIKEIDKLSAKQGFYAPTMLAVDSVTAKPLKSTADAIEKAGFADRAYAVEAGSLTRFIPKIIGDISEHPIGLFMVVHLKVDKQDDNSWDVKKRTGGGQLLDFQATYKIEVTAKSKTKSRVAEKGSKTLETKYKTIQFSSMKNSNGDDDRKVEVELSWKHLEDKNGRPRQYTTWQWDAALPDLIRKEYERVGETGKEKIDEVCHIRKQSAGRYSSDTFNIPSKDPVKPEVLGKLIEDDPVVLQKLRDLWAIKPVTEFETGPVSYTDQLRRIRESMV